MRGGMELWDTICHRVKMRSYYFIGVRNKSMDYGKERSRRYRQEKRTKGFKNILGTDSNIEFCSDNVSKREGGYSILDSNWTTKKM